MYNSHNIVVETILYASLDNTVPQIEGQALPGHRVNIKASDVNLANVTTSKSDVEAT